MAAIQKLTPELIGKIAAGEVVERPASVVKELVENAIDAAATNVTVELRGGGVDYIRISDNGKGIPAEQIRLAFERHATSKLQTEAQLFDIHTLGFRGEALASVAAVAKVTCTTKTADEAFGVRCTVEGGEMTDIRQAASPGGTTLIVENLFYNTPVRLKFLKKPALEAAAVSDYMLRLILSHPEIAFRFVSEGKTVYHSMGDGKLDSALFCLFGKEALRQMIPVNGDQSGVLVTGYVGAGELSRGNRQQQSFFVNGRFFKSALLSRAVESGCEGRLMVGKFPMCALFLQLPYQNVDVNVHPNKLEVRFQNEGAVAEAVRALVWEAMHGEKLGEKLSAAAKAADDPAGDKGFAVVALSSKDGDEKGSDVDATAQPTASTPARPMDEPAPSTTLYPPLKAIPMDMSAFNQPLPNPKMRASGASAPIAEILFKRYEAADTLAEPVNGEPAAMPAEPWPAAADGAQAAGEAEPLKAILPESCEQITLAPADGPPQAIRLIGVAFNTYWLFEAGDRLLMVDQHAAHERILYDRLMARYQSGQLSQQLLSPQLVTLSPHDMALCDELQGLLAASGFQVERFDERSVAVHAIPTLFGANGDPKALLLETLDEWQAGRGQTGPERMQRQVAQMACKHAIKGGDQLNESQMRGFLADMLKSDSMPTCPHGRPIVVEMTRYEMEKRFKRVT